MRTRFAPSPTGFLHLGHARAAREAFDYAHRQGGQCWLRIEDTDHTRCKAETILAIYRDLDWLGFDWPLPVHLQSQHYPAYAKTVTELIDRNLAYPCLLTRTDIKSGLKPNAQNAKTQSKLTSKDDAIEIVKSAACLEKPVLPFAIRLDLQKALSSVTEKCLKFEETGPLRKGIHNAKDYLHTREDPVIARRDIGCSYMIAGPQDDAVQNMTHIVRGVDLFDETPLQILIQTLMDWPRPLYYHHELVLAETGEKLSKRNLDTALHSLRDAGQTPADIWRLLK